MRALVLLLALTVPARADIFDEADITLETYEVSGSSLDEVRTEMETGGPHGFWAWTEWNATWDGDCQTWVEATITLPELAADAPLTDAQVAEFDRMAEALQEHELGHVQIGLDFAAAVAEAGCPADTTSIHDAFAETERDYDAQTRHGQTQGVTLDEP